MYWRFGLMGLMGVCEWLVADDRSMRMVGDGMNDERVCV